MKMPSSILTLCVITLFMACGCNVSNNKNTRYCGSKNSDKYHVEDCRWAKNIKAENRIWFEDKEEANAAGYVPCKTCIKEGD